MRPHRDHQASTKFVAYEPEVPIVGYNSNLSRFAQRSTDGRITALVAEGLPVWPEDGNLAGISDADLGAMHDTYLAQAAEIATTLSGEDQEAIDAVDVAVAQALPTRVAALRTEAAARLSAADEQAQLDELAALSPEDLAVVVQMAADAAAPPAPVDPPPAVDPAVADRAALAASLAGLTPQPAPPVLGDPGPAVQVATITEDGIAAAVTAGLTAAAPGMASAIVEATATVLDARPAAQPRRPMSAADLGTYRPDGREPIAPPSVRAAQGRLIHSGDVPGVGLGQEFTTVESLVSAFETRNRDIGKSAVSDDEKVVIASFSRTTDIPPERDLRDIANNQTALRRRIQEVCGPEAIGRDPWNLERELPIGRGGIIVAQDSALVASGGLSAPVEPYYPQFCVAQADSPFMESLPSFVAERGGIKLVQPASLGTLTAASQPGLFADGVTNTDTSLVSASAAFTAADVGKPVYNAGASTFIAAGTVINSVTSGTTVVLSAATTGTGTTQSFYLPARNPNNLGGPVAVVTATQDAAGPPTVVKFTYDVPIGSQIEHDVYSVYASLQFANLTARTFPEQVELNLLLANALAARVRDTAAMNYVTGWSTMLTGAKTFGTARQLLAQWEHMAAYYRNHNRMDPSAVLRLGVPAWALNAMRGDYIGSYIGGAENWGLSDDEIRSWFMDRHILPFFYWDGPSDTTQLFSSPGSGAINVNGVNNATPIAIPDYPGSGATTSFRTKLVSFMWAEGTWLGLTTGELNIGLVRDSILNTQNRFRNFEEVWETPAFVGTESLRCTHTIASDGSYGAAVSVTLGAGSGL